MTAIIGKVSNWFLSLLAGTAAFVFTLIGFLMLSNLDEQIVASLGMGAFAVALTWCASQRANCSQAQAVSALIDRLLAVETGDLASPAPPAVRREMPALASAVDGLFTQVRSNIDNVHAMAMYDPVTSLPNRLHFKREGERILGARKPEELTALLFIDLDGFKEVNDSLGHAQGDLLLAMVANRLRVVVKAETEAGCLSPPLLARLAGDEFTLLFPALAGPDEAERIARRALAALTEPFGQDGQSLRIGGSIGVAVAPEHGTELTPLMRAADVAMYHAKASGRSRVCVYDAELARAVTERTEKETALRESLERGEFDLLFQPQVCGRTGAVVAAEALVRWNRPGEAVQLPDSFIAIAEESGLILDLGDWVADAAAAALGRWRALGMRQRLAFNVSPRQLERPDFFERLRKSIAASGSPPWLLELEFTETMVMQCTDEVVAELAALRAEGVSIAIDDFGSGYSNLVRMKDMPLDRVKLDKSLIAEVDTSDSVRTIVSAVIHLIHGIGCEAVAEGVERQEQLDVLRAIGCDLMQGFAFAEAMSESDFVRWTAAQREPLLRAS